MREVILSVLTALTLGSCTASEPARSETSLGVDADTRFRTCDKDPPDTLRRLSLSEIKKEDLRVCLVAAADNWSEPQTIGADDGEISNCSSFSSRHLFQVRTGIGVTQEISKSYELQKTEAAYPNERNFDFLRFAQVTDEGADCVLVPLLSASVPYLVVEDKSGQLLTTLVYFPQITEQYLSGFGIDVNFDLEATAIAFHELIEHKAK